METYVTMKEYAAHRKVAKATVYGWVKKGLPTVKQGTGRRVRVTEADRWLDSGGANGGAS